MNVLKKTNVALIQPCELKMSGLMMFTAEDEGNAVDEDPWANYGGPGDVTRVVDSIPRPQTSFLKKPQLGAFAGLSSPNNSFNFHSFARSSTLRAYAPFGAPSPEKMV